jgi:hypothetical protein
MTHHVEAGTAPQGLETSIDIHEQILPGLRHLVDSG